MLKLTRKFKFIVNIEENDAVSLPLFWETEKRSSKDWIRSICVSIEFQYDLSEANPNRRQTREVGHSLPSYDSPLVNHKVDLYINSATSCRVSTTAGLKFLIETQ